MTIDRLHTTRLLSDASAGDERAANELMPMVYDELRGLAQKMLGDERADHTLQATALVHEAYLKLVDQQRANLRDELHFHAVAAEAMRRILVDYARTRKRQKRGGDRHRVTLESRLLDDRTRQLDVLEIEELLEALHREDERAARIVELRFFGGMTIEKAAEFLNISTATADRDWQYARAWLYDALRDRSGDDERRSKPG